MDYCLAIDVGKGRSCYGLMKNVDVTLGIRDGMETVIRPKFFRHTAEDLEAILKAVAKYPKEEVAVVMESTGIYHLPLARSFRARGFRVDRRQSADYLEETNQPSERRNTTRETWRKSPIPTSRETATYKTSGPRKRRTQRSFHGR